MMAVVVVAAVAVAVEAMALVTAARGRYGQQSGRAGNKNPKIIETTFFESAQTATRLDRNLGRPVHTDSHTNDPQGPRYGSYIHVRVRTHIQPRI